ncbi:MULTISPECIES: type II and III secretion system protein family protein [unclassified Phenylobacterium]|uniref:type II and III secretion system protein family protein n=1 Tax=unclassified Phenylobacterium TaxID=2640670 RepID=UPI00083AF821|nr:MULTISPECIES: pilus assembly protein N-terminal domain-containing protein [unclassified Phenylobacterium]
MKLHRAIAAAMRGLRASSRALASVVACVCTMTVTSPGAAQELASEAPPAATIHAPLDKGVGLRAEGAVGKVVVAQPETARVGPAPDGLYVIGSQIGSTNLLVYDREGHLTQNLDIHVGYDAQALRDLLAEALPGEPITVKQLSSSLLLEGEVSSPSVAAIAERLADQVAPDAVISRLHARAAQVLLDVRIVEVSQSGLRDVAAAVRVTNGPDLTVATRGEPIGLDPPFGIAAFTAREGRLRLDAALQALEANGQLRVVAEPSLVALSGEIASFRAGGEFPFPVPQDLDKIAIEFKPYGAAMTVRSVIRENGTIRVALDAELSDIDPSVSLRVSGFNVPALRTRRAATVADLRDGETFMIAGLLEESSERSARDVPFIGRIPILGRALAPFMGASRRKEARRELAILVTPRTSSQVSSPLNERAVLADARPSPVAPPPSATAARPRASPLRALAADIRDVLRPPTRWARQAASRFAAAFRERA